MVFNFIVMGVFIVWLLIVSFLLFKALANYNQLTHGITTKTLSELLTELLHNEKYTQEQLKKTLTEISSLKLASHHFIQKVGVVRFNPFADTGGDQSFSLVLLDGGDDGIIITSLYARTGVRWYIKTIRAGRGVEHDLSKEEQEALKKATKIQKT